MLSSAGGEWESCERPSPASQEQPLCSLADIIMNTPLIDIVVLLGRVSKRLTRAHSTSAGILASSTLEREQATNVPSIS